MLYNLPTTNHNCFLERSGRATESVFVPYARDSGAMSYPEFLIFGGLYDLLESQLSMKSIYKEVTIYLRTSPETCFERLKQRDNCVESESTNFTIDWLQSLHNAHEDWLLPLDPIIIDGNRPTAEIVQDILTLFP